MAGQRDCPATRLLLLLLSAGLPSIPFPAKGMDGHPMYPCAKLKLDQLFLQWLSLPESQTLVREGAWPSRVAVWRCLASRSDRETARLVQSVRAV